jgi:hypothetical protein
VKLVNAPGAPRLVDHQPRLLQQPQVTRDGRPADWERVGDLANRALARAEQLDDGPPIGVTQSIEWVAAGPY